MFGKKVVERLSDGVHVRWFRRVSEKLVALPNDIISIVFVLFSFLRRRGHVCVCVCVCVRVCMCVFFRRSLNTHVYKDTNNPLFQCFSTSVYVYTLSKSWKASIESRSRSIRGTKDRIFRNANLIETRAVSFHRLYLHFHHRHHVLVHKHDS